MSDAPTRRVSFEQRLPPSSASSGRSEAHVPKAIVVPDALNTAATPATDYAVPLLSPTAVPSLLPLQPLTSTAAASIHDTPPLSSPITHSVSSAHATAPHAAQPPQQQSRTATQPATAITSPATSLVSSLSSSASVSAADGLTFPSALSASIASMSKAELIAQLQQARREAAREAEEARQRDESNKRLALEAELSALSAAVAQKRDVVAMHAQAATDLASQQASYAALQDEIARLQELAELEVKKKETMRAAAQMEVQALRVKLEQERLEQERKARLLAAQIAAVKMEIQDRKVSEQPHLPTPFLICNRSLLIVSVCAVMCAGQVQSAEAGRHAPSSDGGGEAGRGGQAERAGAGDGGAEEAA